MHIKQFQPKVISQGGPSCPTKPKQLAFLLLPFSASSGHLALVLGPWP